MITPGFLSPSEAALLNEAIRQARQTADWLDQDRQQWVDEFPARITSWSSSQQRASWTEETYDQYGARILKPGGRTGSATFSPAFPVGNGLMPPNELPIQVWMRRRVVAVESGSGGLSSIGPVYEFDWFCACAGSGSGSASGSGGSSLVGCCPGAIPNTLTATVDQTSGSVCLAGTCSFPITNNGAGVWSGTGTSAGYFYFLTLTCSTTIWQMSLTVDGGGGTCNGSPPVVTTVSCSPIYLTGTGAIVSGTCTPCDGGAFDITVTE